MTEPVKIEVVYREEWAALGMQYTAYEPVIDKRLGVSMPTKEQAVRGQYILIYEEFPLRFPE